MKKDVILVIDGGIKEDGTLTEVSLARVVKAVEIYKSGGAEKIIMSGGGRGSRLSPSANKTEAQAMRDHALSMGVPAGDIFIEEKSKEVLGNAYFPKIMFLEPLKWNNIIVITSQYHAERAEYVFKKVLGSKYAIEFACASETLSAAELARHAIEEKRKLELAKQWLESVEEGDSNAVGDFINHWHPSYLVGKKISHIQLNDRARDY